MTMTTVTTSFQLKKIWMSLIDQKKEERNKKDDVSTTIIMSIFVLKNVWMFKTN